MGQEDEAVYFLQDYCEFGIGPHILMAVARKTHNDNIQGNSEPVYREVISNEGHARNAYHDILARCEKRPYEWRVYVTANPRDPQAAYFNFRDRMNRWSRDLLNGDKAAKDKMANVNEEWISELHRPQSSATNRFTFDLDGITQDGVDEFVSELPRGLITVRESPNGYHVVTEPFQYPEWEPPVAYDNLDTDGQVHVAQING